MALRAPSRNSQQLIGAFLALASLPTAPVGQTFTATSGMPVRIEIVASCVVSAADLDFGAYNTSTATPARGQTNIELQCSPGLIAEVSLDAGTTPGSNTSRRKLRSESGGNRIDYGHQDAGRTVHWATLRRGYAEVLTTARPRRCPSMAKSRRAAGPGRHVQRRDHWFAHSISGAPESALGRRAPRSIMSGSLARPNP
jgi:spore coat protein U-like protein